MGSLAPLIRPSNTPPGCTHSSAACEPSGATTSTLAAAGRNVRITTEPLSGWAPRYPCGSACRRLTRRSASLIPSLRIQEPQDPGHRDRDPVGSVVQLVPQLVYGLLELEDRQQLVRRLLTGWQQGVV